MKKTSDTLKLAERAALQLGWGFDNSGRAYSLTHPKKIADMFEGLTYTKFELLSLMIRVLMSPVRFGGNGMTPEEAVDSLGVSRIKIPKSASSQDEAVANRVNSAAMEAV